MEVKQAFKLDMAQRGDVPRLYAKQGDTARVAEIILQSGGSPWIVPEGTTPIVRYRKADGTTGMYDTLPDGSTPAATADGNVLSVNLAPQMLTCPGAVQCDVALVNAAEVLATFDFWLVVEQPPADGTDTSSQNYYKVLSRNDLNVVLTEFAEKIDRIRSGQPIPVTRAAEMVDSNCIYLYLGKETGYAYGYVYVCQNGTWTTTGLYGKGQDGSGADGTTFTPSVDANGNLRWSNDGGLSNPATVNIKGPKGDAGNTPVRGVDYWTDADKAEIIQAVLDAIDGTVWGSVDAQNQITLSGVLSDGDYTLKYEHTDGTVTEIGTLTVGAGKVPTPSYTNLFDPSVAELNKRWSGSSYNFVTSGGAGHVVSGFIPIPTISTDPNNPTLLRFRGGSWAGQACVIYYDSSKTIIQATNMSDGYGVGAGPSKEPASTDSNGDTYVRLGYRGALDPKWSGGAAAYIRLTLQVNAAGTAISQSDIQGIIVTVDEPIVE